MTYASTEMSTGWRLSCHPAIVAHRTTSQVGPKFAISPWNMAVVHILVDGNGLLEHWPTLAPGKSRTSEAAREELFAHLTQYHDSTGIPITLIFVGPNTGTISSTPDVEIVFTPTPKAAENFIFRTLSRLKGQAEVTVVTDNLADHNKLVAAGGKASSCADFIHDLESAFSELEQNITRHNQTERDKFAHGKIS